MHSQKLLLTTLLALGIAGCRDPGPEVDNKVVGKPAVQPAADSTPKPVEPPAVKGLARPLPGGVEALPFSYHVSVDRDTNTRREGKQVREIGLELLGAKPNEAEAQLTELLQQAGGAVVSRDERGEAARVIYALPDSTQMLVWYRRGAPKGERYALQRKEATGTVYFAWPWIEKGDK